MATATVGLAMGAAGTDAAIETADIALMQDDLGKIAETIRLGRRTLGIIHFNIAFALGLKALVLLVTLLGHASLWLAIMADTGATLLVIANALRLLAAPKSVLSRDVPCGRNDH
jgi:Cd2+/Zn2+-exporting ATPase